MGQGEQPLRPIREQACSPRADMKTTKGVYETLFQTNYKTVHPVPTETGAVSLPGSYQVGQRPQTLPAVFPRTEGSPARADTRGYYLGSEGGRLQCASSPSILSASVLDTGCLTENSFLESRACFAERVIVEAE